MFGSPGPGNAGTNLAEPLNFNDLFVGSLFRIPEYQRGYSWEQQHLEKFIQDIRTIIANYNDPNNIEHHNFGTVQSSVSEKLNPTMGRVDDRVSVVRVSDGQQRLITTLLFLRAVAERIADEYADPAPLDGLKENFLASYRRIDRHDQPTGTPMDIQRLTLNHPTFNNCLKDLIMDGAHSETTPTPVTKMKEALEWFRDELQDDDLPKCQELLKTILKRSELVLLRNKNSLEFMVFEARNNRGRQVSELDKVKNLIQLIEHRGHITGGLDFPSKWFKSLMDLDKPGIELSTEIHENRILSYALSLGVLGRDVKKIEESYTEFHKVFWTLTERPHTTKEKQLKKFVSTFVEVVEAYRQLRRADITLPRFDTTNATQRRGKEAAQKYLHNIRLTKRVGILEPILIAAYLKISKSDSPDFAHVCREAEKALFRVYVAPDSRQTDWRKPQIFKNAHDIYKIDSGEGTEISRMENGNFIACLPRKSHRRPLRGLSKLKPDEHAIHFLCKLTLKESRKTLKTLLDDIIESKNAYNPGSVKWGRYVIFQYEQAVNTALTWNLQSSTFAGGKDTSTFHAEHIMPQNPRTEEDKRGNEIKNYWERGGPPLKFNSDAERQYFLHHLGNLVLSSHDRNTWYENHPYRRSAQEPAGSGDKRTMYRDTRMHGGDFQRVYEVAKYYKEWNQYTIQHRQKLIAIWAVDRWKMDCRCEIPIEENQWPKMELLPELTEEFRSDFGGEVWFSDEEPDYGELPAETELDELADYDETLVTEDGQEPGPPPLAEEADGATQPAEIEISNATERNVWVEKTQTKDAGKEIPDRISGPKALGRAIWSPQQNAAEQDIYAEMREIRKGDLIIHLVNNSPKETYISGVSVVKNDGVIEDKSVQWAGRECPGYRHELEYYIELREPINKPHLLSEGNKEELNEIAQEGKVFYTSGLDLRQGHYLTPCTPRLANLINQICIEVNNSPLPHFGEQQTSDTNSTETMTVSLEQKSVKEAEQYYGGEANLGPAWPDDNFVFGSERPGYPARGKVKNSRVNSWANVMEAHGIRRVVCLLHPEGKLRLYDDLEAQYNSHFGSENVLMAPIIDYDISSKENIKTIVDFLDESVRLEMPVVVHCSMGSGRTGHVLAVWRNYHHGVNRGKALGQSDWGIAERDPKEALGRRSERLDRLIEITDYYDLMNEVRKDEEE